MENPENPSGPAPENLPEKCCNKSGKPMLPGSLAALILGISSLAGMAFFGWIPAIIGLSKAKEAARVLKLHPSRYSDSTIRMAQAGRTMSMVGLILGLLGILVWIAYFSLIFWVVSEANSYSGYDYY